MKRVKLIGVLLAWIVALCLLSFLVPGAHAQDKQFDTTCANSGSPGSSPVRSQDSVTNNPVTGNNKIILCEDSTGEIWPTTSFHGTGGSPSQNVIYANAAKYNLPLANYVLDASWPASADPCGVNCATVTTQSTDPCFGASNVGNISFATNGGNAPENWAGGNALLIAQTTITSVISCHVAIVGVAATGAPSTSNRGAFFWGKDATTALNSAWTDVLALCTTTGSPVLQLPAGSMLVTGALFQGYSPCNTTLNNGVVQAPIIQGEYQNSWIIPTPGFNFASCGNACFSPGGVNVVFLQYFGIWGGSNPCSGTHNVNFVQTAQSFWMSYLNWCQKDSGTVGVDNSSTLFTNISGFGHTGMLFTGPGGNYPFGVADSTFFGDTFQPFVQTGGNFTCVHCYYGAVWDYTGSSFPYVVGVHGGTFHSIGGYSFGNDFGDGTFSADLTGVIVSDNDTLNETFAGSSNFTLGVNNGTVTSGGSVHLRGDTLVNNAGSSGYVFCEPSTNGVLDEGGNKLSGATAFVNGCKVFSSLGGISSFPASTFTVGTLPSASATPTGTSYVVTDALPNSSGTCVGGGSTSVIAVDNGASWRCNAIPAGVNPVLTGTTGSIGGSALLAGQCAAGTVTVTGATSAMVATASPSSDPDSNLSTGVGIYAFVSGSNTVTVRVCAIVAVTPAATTYNVRVIQ